MSFPVRWLEPVQEVFEQLPAEAQEEIDAKIQVLRHHPDMYQLWLKSRRFRRHRQFVVGDWRIFYRVSDDVIWIRGLWPARMPIKLARRAMKEAE